MTEPSEFERLMDDKVDPRRLEQQLLLLDAAEQISILMQRQGVTRTELARRIGKSKGFVTQILNGQHNMTLRTLADLAWALDARVRVAEVEDAASSPKASRRQRRTQAAQSSGADERRGS